MKTKFQDHAQSTLETQRLKKIAVYLDSYFQLPFGWHIGWDGIIGLIPGAGDMITNSISFYIVYRAALIGCPLSVVLRMCLNILIDNLLDAVPFIGFILDFIWNSNLKNVDLLEKFLENPEHTRVASETVLIFTVLFALFVIFGSVFLTFAVLYKLSEHFLHLWFS